VRGKTNPASIFWVECVALAAVENYGKAWADLVDDALEPNVFLEPSFAIPAAHFLGSGKHPVFLLVWEQVHQAPRSRLMALWPLMLPKALFSFVATTWRHDFSCLGSPLLRRSAALPSLNLIFDWLTRHHPNICFVSMNQIDQAGPTYRLLQSFGSKNKRIYSVLDHYERAMLNMKTAQLRVEELVSTKKRKDLHRQMRRLRELGDVAFGFVSEGADLRAKIETFIVLEAKGWKGEQKTAFLNNEAQLSFLRAMTGMMSQEAKCRVYWLSLNGNVIAANIMLLGRDNRVYFWKTAYDEAYRTSSPGVLLTIEMTDRLLQEKVFILADSCAMQNHPMIDHIWRDRIELVDI
jgi:hypothetical protein